jgi:hypothetical protein
MESYTHPMDIDIERLAADSPFLNAAEKDRILLHLDVCAFCRELYDAFVDVHATVRTALQEDPSAGIVAKLDALHGRPPRRRAHIIPLFPIRKEANGAAHGHHAVAMAAKDADTGPRFVVLCNAATRDERAMLRVLRDTRDDTCRGQIVSEDTALFDTVLISFDGIDGYLGTDETGLFTLDPVLAEAAAERSPRLHLAVAEFHIDETMMAVLRAQGSLQATNAEGDAAVLHVETPSEASVVMHLGEDDADIILLLCRGGSSAVLYPRDGSFRIPIGAEACALNVFLR